MVTYATTLTAAAAVDAAALVPSINAEASPNVTVALGKTALLTCRIRGMNNSTVSSEFNGDAGDASHVNNRLVYVNELFIFVSMNI